MTKQGNFWKVLSAIKSSSLFPSVSSGEHGLLGVLIVTCEQKDLRVNSKGLQGLTQVNKSLCGRTSQSLSNAPLYNFRWLGGGYSAQYFLIFYDQVILIVWQSTRWHLVTLRDFSMVTQQTVVNLKPALQIFGCWARPCLGTNSDRSWNMSHGKCTPLKAFMSRKKIRVQNRRKWRDIHSHKKAIEGLRNGIHSKLE